MFRLATLALGMFFASCSATPNAQNLSPVKADSLIRSEAASSKFTLVDIRTPEEFATGHLKGAIPMDFYAPDFQAKLGTLPRDAKIVIYCRSGNRSGKALSAMNEMGFKDASHIAGGINAWRAQSLPVEP